MIMSVAAEQAVSTVVGRLSHQLDGIAMRMVERYRLTIVEYKLADHDFLYDDVYRVSLDGLQCAVATLEGGRQACPEEFEGIRVGAARRVHQGINLEAFLHAVRLWGQVLWESVLGCTDQGIASEREAALIIAGRVLEHIDMLSIAAAQGYLDELQAVWSDREVIRHDLLESLIAGEGDSERVRRLARSLRLRLCQSYLVVVIRTGEWSAGKAQEYSPTERALLRRIVAEAHARLSPTAGSLLVGMRHGEVIALYPFGDPAEFEVARELCLGLAAELRAAGVNVGISGVHTGLAPLARSYAEAREAVEIAASIGDRGRVVTFEEVLIDSVVRSSRHAEQILDTTIAPLLAYDAEHRADLVPTLRAYVDAGFNLTKSAENRHVHPNTVVYRLRRIKELTGRDPHVPDDLLLLHLGLKLIGPSAAE